MTYEEARKKALSVKWKIGTCSEGEKCWCRVIKCEEPMLYKEQGFKEPIEYHVASAGELDKETAEHIVMLHNEKLNN